MVRELLRLAKVDVILIHKALIVENALLPGLNHGLSLNFLLKAEQRSKHGHDRLGQALGLDFLLATRTRHEGEGDSE